MNFILKQNLKCGCEGSEYAPKKKKFKQLLISKHDKAL